jgi:hypothetical protein
VGALGELELRMGDARLRSGVEWRMLRRDVVTSPPADGRVQPGTRDLSAWTERERERERERSPAQLPETEKGVY